MRGRVCEFITHTDAGSINEIITLKISFARNFRSFCCFCFCLFFFFFAFWHTLIAFANVNKNYGRWVEGGGRKGKL